MNPRVRSTIVIAWAAAFVLGCAWLVFQRLGAEMLTGNKQMLDSSLVKLESARQPQERVEAAKLIGTHSGELVSSNAVRAMGSALSKDPDPAVRAAVAQSLGELAARRNSGTIAPGSQEPQMIEALTAAFDEETDPSVRRSILAAAAAFNEPAAAALLNKGLADPDPSVRETAQKAKLQRERRLFTAVTG